MDLSVTGYEPPIKAIFEKVNEQFDGEVLKAVQRVGIDVDKDELIKALRYDRGQYYRGFYAGAKEQRKADLNALIDELNIGVKCENCPRWDGKCKGHLSWLCRKIREAMNDET